jgi:hypothetical protein
MFLPMDKFLASAQAVQQQQGQPVPDAALMGSVMRGMFFFFFVVEAWVMLSSIGLVLRKGWARISFIVICSISTFFSAIYILIGVLGRSAPLGNVPNATPQVVAMTHSIMTIMAGMGVVFTALFIFIIYKLSTQKIAQEFLPQPKQ